MHTERPLGIFETAETLTDERSPYNVVGVIELETGLDPAGLRSALDRAQRRHPLLRARTALRRDGYHFVVGDAPPIPLSIVEREDDDHWRRLAERELNLPFDVGAGSTMRCSLLAGPPGANRRELVVSFPHVIIDGSSAVNLVREILEAWDAAAAGRDLGEPGVLELQPPVEHFFPAAYTGLRAKLKVAGFMARQLADEVNYRWRARGTRQMPIHHESQCRMLNRVLGADDLEGLVRATRRHRVTLNSALNAAMLTVVQRRLYDGGAVPLRNFNFGIVRPYLQPPVDDHHLGSFYVMLRSTVALAADQGFWPLASRINTDFVAMAKRGDKFLALLTVANVMRLLLGQQTMRMGATALAYTGPFKLPETIGAIRLRGVRAMVSNLAIGPEYTAHARLWHGRLWWDQVYLDCDMDDELAAGITDEILEELCRLGRETT